MKDDYGYFGKGLDGYIAYEEFMERERPMLDRPYAHRASPWFGSGSLITSPLFWTIIIVLSILDGISRA